jgi:hypothetical protein
MRCLTVEECRLWRKEHSGRREWKRRLTCVTPLKRLPWFTELLAQHLAPFRGALLIIDQVVFSVPPELEALRRAAGETRIVLEAPGHLFDGDVEEFRRVLEIVLSGWFDFRVLFWPTRHALRADHDEWTTVFSTAPGAFAALKVALREGEVRIIESADVEAP